MNSELTGAGTHTLIDALLDSPDMQVFLKRLVSIAGTEFGQGGDEAQCSVTVWRKRRPLTIVSSDPETAALDEVQYATNEGPCIQAALTGRPAEVVDVQAETKWPRFIDAMAGSAMRSVLAVPIPLQTSGGAALNCYSPFPGPVPDRVREALQEFTKLAGRAVTLSVKLQTETDKSAHLAAALESRTAINLAAGVIMAQTGCDQEQAVNIMMRASNNRNEKLRDVARSVLARFNGTIPTAHFDWS